MSVKRGTAVSYEREVRPRARMHYPERDAPLEHERILLSAKHGPERECTILSAAGHASAMTTL